MVFDCVAEQSTTDQALAMVMKGGTVIVVGVPPADVTIPLPLIQDAQLRIQGSATYLPDDFRESMRLLESGEVDVSEMVTAVHPLDEAAARVRRRRLGPALESTAARIAVTSW